MPVTFDNSTATVGGALVSLTVALTVANGAVLLAFTANDNTRSVSAMAYNGVAMTRLGGAAISSRFSELWVLTAPAVGANNLVVNFTGACSCGIFGMSYTNVKDVGGFGTVSTGISGNAALANLSVSSTNTDLVVACAAWINVNALVFNNGTTRGSLCVSTTCRMVIGEIAGAASVTLSSSSTAIGNFFSYGIPLIFSAAAASGLYMSLLGVAW